MENSYMTRDFYVSHLKDKEVFHSESNDGVLVYSFTSTSGKPAAIGFAGKSQKPAFHYSFGTPERRTEYVMQWLNGLAAVKARKLERSAARKAFTHSLQVGDMLHSSWGYEQTNNDFYQVIEIKGKSVMLHEIGCTYDQNDSAHWLAGHVTPRADDFKGPPFSKLVREGNRVTISSYSNASPVEAGKRYYDSKYA